MARAHLHRPVTDSEGNVVPNTKITFYEAGTTQLLLQPLYVNPLGGITRTNPFVTSDGYVDIYLDKPQTVRIGLVVPGSTETYIEDISVLPAPENQVQAQVGFQIQNTATPGQFLQSGQPGVAAWVDAADIVNSKPSPLNQVKQYDWSGGVLDNATLLDASFAPVTPTYVDVTADVKPVGWTFFTKALRLPTTGPVTLTSPAQTFPESGTAIFLYKVVSTAAGVGAAQLHVSVDADLLYAETPTVSDLCNTWLIGFLDEIPSGSHRIVITHRPGTDLTSYVLIGPVWMQAGNNIPAHDHPGTALDSTRIGTGALADFAGSTVYGAGAKALEQNSTAFGFGAQAGLRGLALGMNAIASQDAVAVGHNAGNVLAKTGWVAVGKDAQASDDQAVAVGVRAKAQGASSVALGPDAKTGVTAEGIAIGSTAQALALRSVAIGRGAVVAATHDYSIAIGAGVLTTAARQAVIGDSATTLVVPGSLKTTGGDANFGGPTSKLGFYGVAGITKPTVLGSRGGNATLASLLTLLANMGLITDGTSA